jgi:2-phosphosulfolactate phosphatase
MPVIRCDWARNGLDAIGRGAAVAIVDVFSFGTAVTLAVERGASVYAWPGDAAGAAEFAAREQAILCTDRSRTTFSLSPESLLRVEHGTRLVLPSLNGASLVAAAMPVASAVVVASLRNASAVARWLGAWDGPIAVIAAGERWPDDTTRFALEDWLGAGAVLAALGGTQSSEARSAAATFTASRAQLAEILGDSFSGRELVSRGFSGDVALASDYDASAVVPVAGIDGWLIAAAPLPASV